MNKLPVELLTVIATDTFESWVVLLRVPTIATMLCFEYAQTIAKQKFITTTPTETFLNGKLHSFNDLPCVFMYDAKYWYKYGKIHRTNGPAIKYTNDVGKEWWVNGVRHRENDLPAVIYKDSVKEWWYNGKRHREKLPAIKRKNGRKEWFLNDKRHREGGLPAIEHTDCINEWWVNGKRL